jgi:hypothetical protein
MALQHMAAPAVNRGLHRVGTVFKLAPDGTETVLYAFTGENGDGALPFFGGLIHDKAGNLYDTTWQRGGTGCDGYGCGTVFKLAPDGTETVPHAFGGGSDGANPHAGMVKGAAGGLYGTASAGGKYGYGTVFRLGK